MSLNTTLNNDQLNQLVGNSQYIWTPKDLRQAVEIAEREKFRFLPSASPIDFLSAKTDEDLQQRISEYHNKLSDLDEDLYSIAEKQPFYVRHPIGTAGFGLAGAIGLFALARKAGLARKMALAAKKVIP